MAKRIETPLRLRPRALKVPISLVLSRTAMPIVLTVLITTMTMTMQNMKRNIMSNMPLTFE